MTPTISGGQGQCSPPRLADPLLHVQRVNSCRSLVCTGLRKRRCRSDAPKHAPDLRRGAAC
jgi:hypothetical protein